MNILVINSGSATLKLDALEIAPAGGQTQRLAQARFEQLGSAAGLHFSADTGRTLKETRTVPDHTAALQLFLGWLRRENDTALDISAVGHRVVHGGPKFNSPKLLTPETLFELESLHVLAPLHNPPAMAGIRAARGVFGPDMPMVAVFDTAFHRTLPEHAATYALPAELARRHGIRRYGFHGLAHESMLRRYSELTGSPTSQGNLITVQLGGGCSVTAIREGRSVDTSMGFTPLEGLMMATRAGDIDPGALMTLLRDENLSSAALEEMLNRQCGLLGVSGRSADMRELLTTAPNDTRAALAVEMFCYRVSKYVGAFLAALGGAQAVVFGGGIGENSPEVRARICERLPWFGLRLDASRNLATLAADARISDDTSRLQAWVVAVDESVLVAGQTAAVIENCASPQAKTEAMT
ncbi:MAG: acetate/propionate family kinase [Verrucomicrobiales bacterium]|nr:acetate/propionate family kinase [Verrucomicrobiales bacterium]